MNKTAVVTGGSSGIGRETCRLLREKGLRVFELSRRDIPQEGVTHLTADVTDERAVAEAFKKIGSFDILVTNAGSGISGAAEFTELQDARRQMDVNFFGTVNCIKNAIPYLRETKGRIVSVSSVAGPIAIPFQSFYSASKAAVDSYVLAVANEVRPFGISACAVLPGDVKTGFTGAREKCREGDGIYGGRIEKAVSAMEKDETGGMDPAVPAGVIVRAALKKRVRPFYIAGAKYRFLYCLFRLLPTAVSNYLVGVLY